MIIPNGYIQLKAKAAGGFDANGYPLKATDVAWGEPIPCQYQASTYNRLAKVMGEAATEQGYTILFSERRFTEEQLRLVDDNGNEVGCFSIKQVEQLRAVRQTQIIV